MELAYIISLALLSCISLILAFMFKKAKAKLGNASLEAEILKKELELTKNQIKAYEEMKGQMVEAAKAGVLESASKVSSKLLEDHKREIEHAKKQSEGIAKQTTDRLFKEFDAITKSVASLKSEVKNTSHKSELVWRTLSNPTGAGYFAEIGLENTLKNFGLIQGVDFIMQYSVTDVDGARLRPDAVMFLPCDTVVVIDSKASKAMLEIAEAEGDAQEQKALERLSKRMNYHLKELSSKKYHKAILDSYKDAGHENSIKRIFNVMYLPSDTALEKITKADKDFARKACSADIIVTGSTGLASIINLAKMEIGIARQEESQKQIIEGVEKLLESVTVSLSYISDVGKGIKNASDKFRKFSTSINTRLIPRAKKLEHFGIRTPKSMPNKIDSYTLEKDTKFIEIEPEELKQISEKA